LGRSWVRSGVVAVAAALAALPATAQPEWYDHYRRGLELESQGAWEASLQELEAAARLQPRPRRRIPIPGREPVVDYDPHYHMARCLTELGRYPRAVAELRIAGRAAVTPRSRLDELRQRLEHEIARHLATPAPSPQPTAPPAAEGRLEVTSEPPGARVFVDGAPIGSTPLTGHAVAAGAHEVRLELQGFTAEEETVTVTAGGTYSLDRTLRALPMRTAPPRRTAAPAREAEVETPEPEAAATAPTTPAPPATPSATAIAVEETRAEPRRGLVLLALGMAAALAVLAALALARRHRRLANPATTPTRILEATPTQVRSGQSMGAYELTAMLGRGGMATTYRASRATDGFEVAIKVPHEGCFTDPTYRERFLREGRLGEQLHHPRIVRIFEANEQDGRPFLAMELLSGRTVKQELRERGPLAVRRAVEIAADIAEALDYAHVKGVVHRDLKPENVMLLPDGSVKVMDFGIARLTGQEGLTSSQFFLGTPLYAAPEMIEPRSIDHRVDLYSLGIILYEMLQGTVPFAADSPFKVLQMHQRDPLPDRSRLPVPVPERVWSVVERLCAKQPDDRYPSAEALLVELHALLRSLPTGDESRG